MKWLLAGLAVLVLMAAAAGWVATAPVTIAADELPGHAADAERGRYVFLVGGCANCHAAPDAEGEAEFLLGGGGALKTPFGVFYAPNISPHPDGIGGWTELDFVNAMMRGVSPGGRHYYPAFPYFSYRRMAFQDVLDLKAFLDTLPPVEGSAPAHDLPLLFAIRRGIGVWKLLYMDDAPLLPDPAATRQLNRGAYLVNGPGHCGECHTPRDALGGPIAERAFAGGRAPEGDGTVPNITPHPDGIGDWSIDDLEAAFRTGFLPDFETFGGAMVDVQKNLARLTDEDREAIALYLNSLPPIPDQPSK